MAALPIILGEVVTSHPRWVVPIDKTSFLTKAWIVKMPLVGPRIRGKCMAIGRNCRQALVVVPLKCIASTAFRFSVFEKVPSQPFGWSAHILTYGSDTINENREEFSACCLFEGVDIICQNIWRCSRCRGHLGCTVSVGWKSYSRKDRPGKGF